MIESTTKDGVAVLAMRHGKANAYWDWHITQEHQRNHLSRYQDPASFELAA